MDKIWAKDVKEGEKVKAIFLVSRKAILTAKSGKTYLAVTFQDKTGELEGRCFDKIEELAALFEEKDAVEAEGLVGTFQGRPQLRLEAIAKVDASTLDAADFAWVPPPEPKKPERQEKPGADDALWTELLALVDAVADHHVKTLIKAFVEDDDVAGRLRRCAAAKTVHHAYPGGLLEHTVACLKLAHRIADQYPQLDRDLLVAGAFFHDIGKIRELTLEKHAEYTDEGRLVGHLVMAAQWIHDKARRTGVPRELEHQIVHVVLAHHGRVEFGSPRPPMSLEAMVVHYIDDLDSRVNSWLNLMGREGGGGRRWTDSNNVYEQPIWRGALPTTQAEKKGPPPEVLSPVIYVPREGSRQGRTEPPRKPKQKPPRPPQEPTPAGEAKPAEGGAAEAKAEAKPEGAPHRSERPPRPDRPDRGGFRGGPGPGGFGDKKRGYQGPRLPGDRGPQARPAEKKLTHNPFAALAAKLEDGGKGEGAPAEAPAAAEPAAEPTPPATGEAPSSETPTT
jgi:3'-5' exoribonuclease